MQWWQCIFYFLLVVTRAFKSSHGEPSFYTNCLTKVLFTQGAESGEKGRREDRREESKEKKEGGREGGRKGGWERRRVKKGVSRGRGEGNRP